MQNTFQDQEILNAVHAVFADGPFNEDALTAVRHYVTFRLNEADRKSGVPYNILLLCDDTDRCKDFIARSNLNHSAPVHHCNSVKKALCNFHLMSNKKHGYRIFILNVL